MCFQVWSIWSPEDFMQAAAVASCCAPSGNCSGGCSKQISCRARIYFDPILVPCCRRWTGMSIESIADSKSLLFRFSTMVIDHSVSYSIRFSTMIIHISVIWFRQSVSTMRTMVLEYLPAFSQRVPSFVGKYSCTTEHTGIIWYYIIYIYIWYFRLFYVTLSHICFLLGRLLSTF